MLFTRLDNHLINNDKDWSAGVDEKQEVAGKCIYLCVNFSVREAGAGRFSVPKSDKSFIEELNRHGYHVKLVAQNRKGFDAYADGQLEDSDQLSCVDLGTFKETSSTFNKLSSYLCAAVTFLKLRSGSAVWYIYFPGTMSVVAALVCILLHRPYGLYVRGEWRNSRLFSWLSKPIFANAEFIHTTGRAFKAAIQPVNKVVNPVSPMISLEANHLTSIAANADNDRFTLLFVGHLRESKGIFTLIDAVAMLRDEKRIAVTVAGGAEPDEFEKVKAYVADREVESQFTFLGHLSTQSDLRDCYLNADAFIFPSVFQEGFPRVVYEAMLMQLPILCNIQSGMRNFMSDRDNCIELTPHDVNDLAQAIVLIMQDDLLREKIARQAVKDVCAYLRSFKNRTHAGQVHEQLSKLTVSA